MSVVLQELQIKKSIPEKKKMKNRNGRNPQYYTDVPKVI